MNGPKSIVAQWATTISLSALLALVLFFAVAQQIDASDTPNIEPAAWILVVLFAPAIETVIWLLAQFMLEMVRVQRQWAAGLAGFGFLAAHAYVSWLLCITIVPLAFFLAKNASLNSSWTIRFGRMFLLHVLVNATGVGLLLASDVLA